MNRPVLAAPAILGTALLACATTPVRSMDDDARRGWRALADGDRAAAMTAFSRALARSPDDLPARFGRATAAYESADPAAYDDDFAILESAGAGTAAASALVGAAAARLLAAADDILPAAWLPRLRALPFAGLPIRARLLAAEIVAGVARRAGDRALLAGVAGRAGCVTDVVYLGRAGRLTHLDLDVAPPPEAPPRSLAANGCTIATPDVGPRPGVAFLRARFRSPAGLGELLVDYAGPGRIAIDGQPGWTHNDPARERARITVLRRTFTAGEHVVALALGHVGGPIELRIVFAAAPARVAPGGTPIEAALMADLWMGGATASPEAVIAATAELSARPRFAAGWAAAARALEDDDVRPGVVIADRARGLRARAVGVDPELARAWHDWAAQDAALGRPREAVEHARAALRLRPAFAPAAATLAGALRARGLDFEADEVLRRAAQEGAEVCAAAVPWLRLAQERLRAEEIGQAAAAVAACDVASPALASIHRRREDHAALEGHLRRRLFLHAGFDAGVRRDLAALLLATGRAGEAAALFAALVAERPWDAGLHVALADAQAAASQAAATAGANVGLAAARATLSEAVRHLGHAPEVARAARALGLPAALDDLRVDGATAIRDFVASGRRYDAPAAIVLDRSVERVFPSGARAVITHTIVRVQSQDALGRWGEVNVPEGAQVLTLRTVKADGSVRTARPHGTKPSLSAPELAVGDYVESEFLEAREPDVAFAPGFLADRFYFQSLDAPLDRTEYLVVVPADVEVSIDARPGAPALERAPRPDGTILYRFAAREVPQRFAEEAPPPPVEWLPSVRLGAGATAAGWARYLADRLVGHDRVTPEVRHAAREVRAAAAGAPLLDALCRWLSDAVEPGGDVMESATSVLVRRRGSRVGPLLALGRALGLRADLWLARPHTRAAADAPIIDLEPMDFSDLLVRFATPDGPRWVSPHARRLRAGYLPRDLAGVPALVVGEMRATRTESAVPDERRASLEVFLRPDGGAEIAAVESLVGGPALDLREWYERLDSDPDERRRAFEQRWVAPQFGATHLAALTVELGEDPARATLRYRFVHETFAARDGDVLTISPTWLRNAPGRRYAREARRTTPLLIGPEATTIVAARIVLPVGARVVEAGVSGTSASPDARGFRFEERREAGDGVLLLRRTARAPAWRVSPARYGTVSPLLREVDAREESRIRIDLGARRAS